MSNENHAVRCTSREAFCCDVFSLISKEMSSLTRKDPDVARECDFVSLSTAVLLSGQTQDVVRNWLKAGYLGEVALVGGQFRISVPSLLEFLDLVKDSYVPLEAARILGVLPRALYRLIDYQVLPVVVGVSGAICRVAKDAIRDSLGVLLSSVFVEAQPRGKIRTVGAILASNHNAVSLKAFQAIRDGRLRVYCADPNPTDLSGVYVYENDYMQRRGPDSPTYASLPRDTRIVLRGDVQTVRRGCEWVTLSVAKTMAGVTRAELERWIQDGLLGTLEVVKNLSCVSLSKVLKAIDIRDSTVSICEASRLLRMPRRVLLALVRDRIVNSVGIGSEARINSIELEGLSTLLFLQATPMQKLHRPGSVRPLRAVLGAPFEGAVHDALLAIDSGKLDLYAEPNCPECLEEMWVRDRQYEIVVGLKYRHSKRSLFKAAPVQRVRLVRQGMHLALHGDEYVPWGEAWLIAGCTEYLLKQWVGAGMLTRRHFRDVVAVSMSELLYAIESMSDTLVADEAAKRLSTSRNGLLRLIETNEIAVVSVVGIKTLLVRRSSVEQFVSALLLHAQPWRLLVHRVRPLNSLFESKARILGESLRSIRDGHLQISYPAGQEPGMCNCFVDVAQYWKLKHENDHAVALSRGPADGGSGSGS